MPVHYQYCRVCRQNHDQGKGHRFSTKHKQRLDALLKKIQKNVQELKNTMRLKANLGSRSKFWCHFCEQEICEDTSVFACVETIRHLASKQHVESVKSFWFANGGDVLKRQSFCISEADLGKRIVCGLSNEVRVEYDLDLLASWMTNVYFVGLSGILLRERSGRDSCKAVPHEDGPDLTWTEMNNIQSERYLADATCAKNVNQSSVVCGSALAVKPLSVLTDQSFPHYCHANGKVELAAAISNQPWTVDQLKKPQFELEAHPDGMIMVEDMHAYTGQVHSQCQLAAPSAPKYAGASISIRQTESAIGQNLTAIKRPSLDPGEGNVHSGALPPWLKHKTDQGLQAKVPHSASPALPLSRNQQRKLAKLRNPNRVGAAWAEQRRAEMARERKGDVVEKSLPDSSAWLPSFGRVWQSGSRRETRKEFEAEKRSERRKRSSGQSRSSNVTSDAPGLRPYVSKRQRTMEGPVEHQGNKE